MARDQQPYQSVHALERGLRILEILSQKGWTKPGKLAGLTSIDRSSTYRLLSTLINSGYVVKRASDGSYALSSKIGLIADGFVQTDLAAQIAAPFLQQLTSEISWPSDFAALIGGEVIILESSHRISPLSMHRAMVGKRRSLVHSSLGQAILSVLRKEELDTVLSLVSRLGGPDAGITSSRSVIAQIVRQVKQRGYAAAIGAEEGKKMGAIALPVRAPNSLIGAVNVIFFHSAMTTSEAAERYLPQLRKCVDDIVKALAVTPPLHHENPDSEES
jgi:IclR family transcriptional regulator, mhp operon transcriptional activator